MSLKKNILRIFSANFLTMISGIIIGFVVPAVLSIESYSYVKTYMFYLSYIGFLHLGFVDGMYIKYGGKEPKDINKSEFKSEHRVFIFMQLIVTLIFLILGVLNKDIIITLMGLSIIPMNTIAFHKMFYQATGQFTKYAKASYLYTGIYLGLNIVLALIFKNQNYIYYCLASLISNVGVYIMLEFRFYKDTNGIKSEYNKEIWNNVKVGFFVLLGNLSVLLFYAIDRWFIKIFLGVNDFAYYSFAVSMLNIINLLVNAIAITFYNYLSKGENQEKIKKMKKYFLILGGFASLGYFALAAVVSVFLKKYIPALSIIAISFVAYPYMIVINALYVNLYKARKNERRYLKVVASMVIISMVYNAIAILIWNSSEAIAVATTLSFITWYIYTMRDFKYLKSNLNELLYLLIIFISFLIFANYFSWFIGGIGYLIVMIIMITIFYRVEIKDIIKIVLKK